MLVRKKELETATPATRRMYIEEKLKAEILNEAISQT
jgi:hypothetical protein